MPALIADLSLMVLYWLLSAPLIAWLLADGDRALMSLALAYLAAAAACVWVARRSVATASGFWAREARFIGRALAVFSAGFLLYVWADTSGFLERVLLDEWVPVWPPLFEQFGALLGVICVLLAMPLALARAPMEPEAEARFDWRLLICWLLIGLWTLLGVLWMESRLLQIESFRAVPDALRWAVHFGLLLVLLALFSGPRWLALGRKPDLWSALGLLLWFGMLALTVPSRTVLGT